MAPKRAETRKARIRRARNKPSREALAHIKAAPVKPDPFEVLAALQFADNEKDRGTNERPLRLFLANIGSRVKKVLARCRIFGYHNAMLRVAPTEQTGTR